jgi:hypothetical protein
MCQRVTCPTCGKPTFTGCGRHVEQVLASVPVDQRCRCRDEARPAQEKQRSLLDRLLGR